jgi:diketogulonate reductase-like aldo/keto reductase
VCWWHPQALAAPTPQQSIFRFRRQRVLCPGGFIPKSTHRKRIAENAEVFNFRLSEEDIAELDALDRTGGTERALERRWWRS